ncbi:Ubiquitin-like protein ATG12 [Debaryomyces fabryi]|uniref:Ubiquitin-like protein ATG12 n=1 Tax=Debaryomyces fabryi TaxID=58627 RepID=A0A0V1PYG6_9ASCO|nr:Ubiquitin-like protein ATG12 [Debaryomyces fabryi]KSA00991.1 Ubiquitin-like protein ATG12 [Debaryomyces fabryi]CUM55420.1 unnamed protein product [Debaryomyces fabryi]
MSMIQSDQDESSDTSEASEVSDTLEDKVIEDEKIETKIPLSTSIVLEKLPDQKQLQLSKITHESNIFKVTIRFQPIGSTPSINPRVFKISSNQSISTISKFLIKKLKIKSNLIYLYIQNSFQPNPDEKLGDLYNLFKTNNELIINYCYSIAFG